jgi:hypothetical protein
MINKMLYKWHVQLTEHLTVWELWYFKAVASYRGKRFHVPTRQTCEYKVDLTRHLKFPLAFGERSFPTLDTDKDNDDFCVDLMDENDNWREVFLLSETEC